MKAIDFFNAMTEGKKLRLNDKGRIFWTQHGKKTWSIQAIWGHDELTLCDNNHQILNGVPFDQVESDFIK
jgi:hypothetical protein